MKSYHGNNKKRSFFEGWFFKHQAEDTVFSVIPGISIDKEGNKIAFIQVITNDTSHYVEYPFSEFNADEDTLYLKIGNNVFIKYGVFLDISAPGLTLKGKIYYGPLTPLKGDIMGPYQSAHLKCNHGIISLGHTLEGEIKYNGRIISFNGGKGYIEKNWGRSFPKSWEWIQCNDFRDADISFMAAVARVPLMGGFSFKGHTSVFSYNGKQYRFASYNGSNAELKNDGTLTLEKDDIRVEVTPLLSAAHSLMAPKMGKMETKIFESPCAPVDLKFYVKDYLIYHGRGRNAAYERMGMKQS